MYVIFSTNKIRAEHLDEFVEQVRVHARNSNEEPGCLRFEVLQDESDPQTICLHEVFADEAAFAAHQAAGYYREWMDRSREWRHDEQRVRHVLGYVYGPVGA